MAVPLQVNDFYDLEIIPSLSTKLGCSMATTYRMLKSAEVPIYYIPGRPSAVLIQRASLWRIAKTPQWKKYLKRLGYKKPGKVTLKKIYRENSFSTLIKAIESGILLLKFEEAIAGVSIGLIPVYKNTFNLKLWYLAMLKGENCFELPKK